MKLDKTLSFGIIHRVRNYGRADSILRRTLKFFRQLVTIEDIVSEHQTSRTVADEGAADSKSRHQTIR